MSYQLIYPGKAKGQPPNNNRATFRLPKRLNEDLRCLAAKYSTTKNDLIRRCVRMGVNKILEDS